MKKTIKEIAKEFNEKGIRWALASSHVLKYYGIYGITHDIDLLIAFEDIERALLCLDKIGNRIEVELKDDYGTKVFKGYEINGIKIDVMSAFIINHECGAYEFILDDKAITAIEEFEGEKILYTSPEDWFVAYMLMKNRGKKVKLIKEYLLREGVSHPELLERAMERTLPEKVLQEIREVLGS